MTDYEKLETMTQCCLSHLDELRTKNADRSDILEVIDEQSKLLVQSLGLDLHSRLADKLCSSLPRIHVALLQIVTTQQKQLHEAIQNNGTVLSALIEYKALDQIRA